MTLRGIPMDDKLREMVMRHEGLSLMPYRCPKGKLTIGYGRNLESKGITEYEADMLLADDLKECLRDVEEITQRLVMDNRTRALVDLRYQTGSYGFKTFVKMIAAILSRDWNRAADELMDSEYGRNFPKRARELEGMLRTGD